ncbi:MAG: DUF3300 domain-containing protein [Wenzhouxiangella sp.]
MNRIAQTLLFAVALLAGSFQAPIAQAQDEFRGFSQAELDQMLAPIALFPDTVLSHVLIASTYPIEVVRAARWTRQNPGLSGEQAVNAVIGEDWDPSVMALVAFPELLARMDGDLDWTQRLGDAFLIQEGDVLDSIQRLRAHAYSAGHLRTTEHVRVVREREVIYIEPPRREVVFVPVYDTRVVFGSWAWAHHPPVFWHAPPRRRSSVIVYWGPAFHVPPAFFFSSFHWPHRQVVVVHHHHHFFHPHRPRQVVHHHHHHHYRGHDLSRHQSAQRWQHDPNHRRGVAYHPAVDERHRQLERRSSASASASVARAPAPAPARVAETRNNQREWADARRSQNLLASPGEQTARPGRLVGDESRGAVARSNQPARPTAQDPSQRAQIAAAQRSPERAAMRGTEPRAEAGAPARAVERQLQSRAAAPREAPALARSAPAAAPQAARPQAAPAPERQRAAPTRPAQDSRTAPRSEAARPEARQIQRQMEGASRPSAPAAASAPRQTAAGMQGRSLSAPTENRQAAPRMAPARPVATQPAPAPRAPASAPTQQRAMPPAASAPAPRRAPDSRPAQAPQRQAAPARENNRSARRVD